MPIGARSLLFRQLHFRIFLYGDQDVAAVFMRDLCGGERGAAADGNGRRHAGEDHAAPQRDQGNHCHFIIFVHQIILSQKQQRCIVFFEPTVFCN
jgi:hypothetical protein